MLSIWRGNVEPTTQTRHQLAKKAIQEVAESYTISVCRMMAYDSHADISKIRHEAMWKARKLSGLSYTLLGKLFGGRDHSTIGHGVRAYEERLRRDKVRKIDLRV
jgi:chromosomal replication initiator protein